MKKNKPKKTKVPPGAKSDAAISGQGTEFRGLFRGRIYSVSKKGKQFSRKARKSRQRYSRARRAVQAGIKLLDRVWRRLPSEKTALWDLAAHTRIRRTNPEVRSRVLMRSAAHRISGFNYLTELNQLARSVGQTKIITEPPLDVVTGKHLPLPYGPKILKVEFDGKKLSIDWALADDVKPDYFVRVWLTSTDKTFHKQLAKTAPASDLKMVITQAKSKGGVLKNIAKLKDTLLLVQADPFEIQ